MERDVPLGSIVSFSGSIANIPGTFRLCDGTDGTPDLRNKFVVGSGDIYAVGSEGGSINHNHDFIGNNHMHFLASGSDVLFGSGKSSIVSSNPAIGTTNNTNGLAPYYSLAFAMYKGVAK